MSAEADVPRVRIVVALNACRRDLSVLDLAAALARQRGCPIEAVFVEELNLINVAELPFTKEVDRLCGAEREFDATRIQRTHQARLAEIRRALERLHERRQVTASLRIVRGHFVPAVLSVVDAVDVLILSCRGDIRGGKPTRSPFQTPSSANVDAAVWVLIDGSSESLNALRVAAEIASAEACPLNVALPPGHESLIAELRRTIPSSRATPPLRVSIRTIDPFDGPTVLRTLRQNGCRMLVVKRSDGELIDTVADAGECPVLLV